MSYPVFVLFGKPFKLLQQKIISRQTALKSELTVENRCGHHPVKSVVLCKIFRRDCTHDSADVLKADVVSAQSPEGHRSAGCAAGPEAHSLEVRVLDELIVIAGGVEWHAYHNKFRSFFFCGTPVGGRPDPDAYY